MSVILRQKELKNKGKSFYLDINHNGKRYYEFLNIKIHPKEDDTPDKKKEKIDLANTIRSQREIELISEGTSYTPKHKKKIDFIEYYRAYLENYEKKDKRMIKYSFEKFNNFIKRNKLQASEVTPKVCEGFKDYLISPKAGLSGETPQNYYSRFKKVLRAATNDGLFKESPANGILFKNNDDTDKLKKEILTSDELTTLAGTSCGNEEVKKAFIFACFTGLGIAEIRKLKWSAINNNRLKTYREKTGSEINIPLSLTAIKIIGERGNTQSLVFDIPISDNAISKDLKNWTKKANIEKNITFYCGRHTYAVLLLLNGANLKTVSDCMAHKNTRHTIKYLNYVDSLKDSAINNLPDVII
jgi:integrase